MSDILRPVNFSLPKGKFVTLKVYNSLGEEAAVLINSFKNAGSYEIKFDGNELSNDVYFYELKAGSFSSINVKPGIYNTWLDKS